MKTLIRLLTLLVPKSAWRKRIRRGAEAWYARRRHGRYDIARDFDANYKANLTTGSGPGSAAEHAATYCPVLLTLLRELQARRVVDYGCGNMEIYQDRMPWREFDYHGVDISEALIAQLRQRHPTLNFHYVPAFTDAAVLHGDVIIVKDVFIHWYDEQIEWFKRTVFPNFKFGVFVHADDLDDYDTGEHKWRPVHHEDWFRVVKKQTVALDKMKNVVVARPGR